MVKQETLSASLEDYLEAIHHIVATKKAARAKDIARRRQVNGSSVTGALRALAARELVNYAPYDVITLTRKGERIARDIVRRHQALRDFFVKVLDVEETLADRCACRMEHALPREILDQLARFVEFVDTSAGADATWLDEFAHYRTAKKRR
ncbi:metal-dependent transcriptional regulator [Candidatus Zixiibacteriota bacterium]